MGWNVFLASKMWDLGFHKIGLCSISGQPLWRDMGYKTFKTSPPLPSYIKPWRQYNLLFWGCEDDGPYVKRTNMSAVLGTLGWRYDVRMVQIITTERSQHQRKFMLRMVWTLNSYSLQKWYLLAVELATAAANAGSDVPSRLGRNRQSIPSTTQRHYYNVSNWQHYSKDLVGQHGLPSTTNLPKRSSE